MGELVALPTAALIPPGWSLNQEGPKWVARRRWSEGTPGVTLRAPTAKDACEAAAMFEQARNALAAAMRGRE